MDMLIKRNGGGMKTASKAEPPDPTWRSLYRVTYGLGVSLKEMRDPAAARARVPVTQRGTTR